MDLKISELELNIALKKLSFISPSFKILGLKKFKISFLKSVEIDIQEMNQNQIIISYDSKWLVNQIISWFKNKIPVGIVVNKEDQLITININELTARSNPLLKSLKLANIHFKDDQLVIQANFGK